jgi:electron transport complex protein RnfG
MLGQSISKNSFILAAFAVFTAGALALTNLGTQERIAAAERAAQQRALFEIIPITICSTTPSPYPIAHGNL